MNEHAAPIVLLATTCHPALFDGFLPAARRHGPVWLFTDHALDHLARLRDHDDPPQRVIECDVFNPLGVLDLLHVAGTTPRAVHSNSDPLQASTALVAAGLGLPGKDWRVCRAAKNKAAARERLRALGLPCPWFHGLAPGDEAPVQAPWPLVAKPREGVGSRDVRLCRDRHELQDYLQDLWQRDPQRHVLLEEWLQGPLFTLETLGDGERLHALGGFRVELSAPPHFVEREARWDIDPDSPAARQALVQLRRFGIGLGLCHSEFILTARGPVLVEINYRSVGDQREFLLDRLFEGQWFDAALAPHLGMAIPRLHARRQALVRYLIAEHEGVLADAHADTLHTDAGGMAWYRRLRANGEHVRPSHSNRDYLGALSVIADDAAGLDHYAERLGAALSWRIEPLPAEPPA